MIVFAAANRQDTLLDLWPLPYEVGLPVFLLVLVPLVLGFLLGGLVAWAQAGTARREARAERRRAAALEREIAHVQRVGAAPAALTDQTNWPKTPDGVL